MNEYQFDLSLSVTVEAEGETEARAKAISKIIETYGEKVYRDLFSFDVFSVYELKGE